MSKIGKVNISIPGKVKVELNGNLLNIEGPLGKKYLNIDTDMFDLKIEEGKNVSIKPKQINKDTKRFERERSRKFSPVQQLEDVFYRHSIYIRTVSS